MPLRSDSENFALIRVIGVGGGGSNAVNRMIRAEMMGVEFIACNTDAQALLQSDAPHKIRIGDKITRGLGAGGDSTIGQRAAEEDTEKIGAALVDSDMVFITAGLGGGTGSGAAPVVAQIAKEPGRADDRRRHQAVHVRGRQAASSSPRRPPRSSRPQVDTLITIPNDRLRDVVQKNTSILDAFRVVDDVLRQGVQGISDIITVPGLINLDFADVRTIMRDAGSALMGIGRATGENRAVEAARQAIASPLLEVNITGAQGILFNITGSSTLSLYEVTEAAEEIRAAADPEANIIFGTSFNERLGDEVMITVIATGFDGGKKRHVNRREAPAVDDSGRHRATVTASATSSRSSSASAKRSPTTGRTRRRRPRRSTTQAAAVVAAPRVERPSASRSRPSARRRTTRTTSRSRASSAASDRGRRAGRPRMTDSATRVQAYSAARERVLARIEDACARAGRDSAEVSLVAVSKTVSADALRDAVAAGLDRLGENRVQEGVAKVPEVPGAHWELVGPLQSNKARRALEVFDAIQTVDSVELGRRLDRLVPEVRPGPRYPVLVQVNVDEDPAKAGFAAGDLDARPSGSPRAAAPGRPRPDDGRQADRGPGRGAPDLPGPAHPLGAVQGALARARPGAVDGDDRRLRARGRGGRDDRPCRPGAVRRATAPA